MKTLGNFDSLGGIIPAAGGSYVPISVVELNLLESDLGAELPLSYKDFVSKYGQSAFEEYVGFDSEEEVPGSPDGRGHFSLFFGGKDTEFKSYSVAWNVANYRDRIPLKMLPIGTDGSGDLLLLSVEELSFGQVFYWDHQTAPDPDSIDSRRDQKRDVSILRSHLVKVASSFGDFLNCLHVSE